MAESMIKAELDDDGIATITLNRPEKRNALSIQLRDQLTATLGDYAVDQAVRVVVITGSGPVFSAGFDLDEFANADLGPRLRDSSRLYHLAVWNFPKPLLAAINGPALGGGFDLAVLCDIRIAADTASFGHPEIKFGAPPLFTPLRWIVGDGIARDLCLTGRRIDAAEAQSVGLVSRVVAADELPDVAASVALQVAEAPSVALEATKAYITASWEPDFSAAFALEHDDVFERFLTGADGKS